MQNIIITLITITISALLVNLLANRLFNVHLKIRPLVLCACCAFLINIVLPRIIMGFVGVIETVGILLIFTIVSAYSIASYNDKFGNPKDPIDTLNQTSLVVQSSTDQQENSCFFEREEATEFIHQEKESEFLEEVLLRDKSEIIMTVAVELPVPTSLVECNTVDTIHIASEQEEQKQIAIPDGNLNDVTVSLEDELSIAEVDLVDEIKTIIESVIPEENPKDITVSLEDESSIAEVDLVDGIKAISESEEQEQVAILEENSKDVTVSLEDELSIVEVDLVDEIKTIIESEEQEQVVIPEENPNDITVSLDDESSIVEADLVDEIKIISESEEQEQVVIPKENPNDVTVSLEDKLFSSDSAVIVDKAEVVAALEEFKLTSKTEEFLEDGELSLTTILDKNDIVDTKNDSSESEDDNEIMNYVNLIGIEKLNATGKVDQMDETFELEKENQTLKIGESSEMIQVKDESQLPIDIFDSNSNDLDSLMDIAFMYKEQHFFDKALSVFRQALSLHPSSEAAPFLVMEIGTILKNNGQYDDAITAFCDGKKLLGLQKDNMFEMEFIKTIAYLRIVKNILHQHHLGFISFNNIPEHVLKEINAEFREWRNPV